MTRVVQAVYILVIDELSLGCTSRHKRADDASDGLLIASDSSISDATPPSECGWLSRLSHWSTDASLLWRIDSCDASSQRPRLGDRFVLCIRSHCLNTGRWLRTGRIASPPQERWRPSMPSCLERCRRRESENGHQSPQTGILWASGWPRLEAEATAWYQDGRVRRGSYAHIVAYGVPSRQGVYVLSSRSSQASWSRMRLTDTGDSSRNDCKISAIARPSTCRIWLVAILCILEQELRRLFLGPTDEKSLDAGMAAVWYSCAWQQALMINGLHQKSYRAFCRFRELRWPAKVSTTRW